MAVRRIFAGAVAAGVLALGATPAVAIRAGQPSGARPQRDVRSGQRTPVPAPVSGARRTLVERLGIEAHLSTDPVGGGVRVLDRTDGFLSGPHAGDPAAIALAWVRAHADVFGLTTAQIDALRLVRRTTAHDGVTHLTWVPESRGIPAYDSELRVHVTRDGRVLTASGPPLGGLSIPSATPALTASQALGVAQGDVGAQTSVPRAATRAGVQRPTTFSNGDSARLVVFDAPSGDRLAWRITLAGKDPYWFDEVVDATTGAVLARRGLTRFAANALVYDYYPGAPAAANDGGSAHTVDISRWLSPSATRLIGPNAHAYADVNNNDTADSNEEIPSSGGGNWSYPISFYTAVCTYCTWNESDFATEATNRAAATTQVFYYVNTFHDWLQQPAVGFTSSATGTTNGNTWGGNFEGADPVLAEADDSVLASSPNGPNFNNANMTTFPDGTSPRMQMYLFGGGFPDVNGGDDASVVYHEYTHGLSNRLIDDANGLYENQGMAMGEGWSDWYAMDYLVANGFQADDPNVDGEVAVGTYVTGDTAHGIRYQPLDCAVGSAAANCGGSPTTAHGGFTYADLGRVGSYDSSTPRFEVHDDGEIWSETLWDLRDRLGASTARELITDGMRNSPANPSFLDERDAILLADQADFGGANHDAIWQVFAHRGMGYGARTSSPNATRAIARSDTPALVEPAGTTIADPGPLGDGDGVAEPGETVRLTLTLDNPGQADLASVHGTLSTATAGVTVPSPDADFGTGTIAAGGSAQNGTPFEVAIGADVACGTLIPFTLHVTSGSGSVDVPVAISLGTGDTVFTSSDVPKTIADGDPTSTSAVSALTVPSGGRVDDLRVTLNVTHSYVGDLHAMLTSPAGTTVDLLERPGFGEWGSSLGWSGPITFDDAAANPIQDIGNGPPYTLSGSYAPDEPLAAFAGEDRAGAWTLRITDNATPDGGTLNGWSLDTAQPACSTGVVRPPGATTAAASAVTFSTATLNGSVDPAGAATSYRFDYGTTAAYGQSTPSASAGSASGTVPESATVSGLASSTTYHFRIVALRGGVPAAFGADKTFTTAAPPPPPPPPPPSGGGGGSTGGGSTGGSTGSTGSTGATSGGGQAVVSVSGATSKATLNARNAFVYAFHATPGLRGTIRFTLPKHGRTKAIAFGAKSFTVAASGRVKLTVKLGRKALAQLRRLHTIKGVSVVVVLDGKTFRFTLRLSAPKPKPRRR